jgi:uncharacterized protein
VITSIGTYLPVWGTATNRTEGDDEDAVTLAVAAGRSALSAADVEITRVVLVTRGLPLLEGGNAAALLGGLDLPVGADVVEQIGGATATLDAVLAAQPGTLVIGVDTGAGAGAAAAVIGSQGLGVAPAFRVNRSLPVMARDLAGNAHDYSDPRLLRERGIAESLNRAGGAKPVAIAGLGAKDAKSLCAGVPPEVPTTGASSPLFCLAALTCSPGDVLAAADQASVTAVTLDGGTTVVVRDERVAQEKTKGTLTPGPEIPISIAAYDRAFDAKLRWQASTNRDTGELDFPPRAHDALRTESGAIALTSLPRTGSIYTVTTIHVPVPGKSTPYQLVIVELDGGVRSLVATTGTSRDGAKIGDRGEVVLRRVEIRSGVPDYGYAFRPDEGTEGTAA